MTLALGSAADAPVTGQAHAASAVRESAVLALDLFPDMQVGVVADRLEHTAPGTTVLYGHVAGAAESDVTLVDHDGVLAGSIHVDSRHFRFRPAGDGLYAIEEFDPALLGGCVGGEATALDMAADAPALNPDPTVALDSGDFVDVMVVYTPAVRAILGGTSGVESLANLAVSETNTGLQNSGVTHRVRLVHTAEVNYDEGSGVGAFTTSLDRLRGTTDGFMDEIHALRTTFGADQVMLLVNDTQNTACGFAYVMTSPSNAFSAWAFSVVAWQCATGNYTFGHELGHNWGAQHDRSNASGPGSYSYSYGYQQQAGPFRTIMGLSSGCNCVRVNHWSNPDVTFAGEPTGIINTSPSAADNRLTLNNNSAIVANWRAAVVPEPATGVTVAPDLPSPQFEGTLVTFTAVGQGGNGVYDYEFALQGPGTGNVMTVQQPYSSDDTWTWNTAGDIGASTIRVRVRSAGTTSVEDASTTVVYTVDPPPPPATGVTLVADAASPQLEGVVVTFTAQGQGGTGAYEYEFAVQGSGTGDHMTVQRAYATDPTWTWTTTGFAGTNTVRVRVRTAGTAVEKDASTTMPYSVTPPASGVTVGISTSSPQTAGTSVTFSAAGQGGSGTYEYQFWRRSNGTSAWTLVQDYGPPPAWVWDTTGFNGSYLVLAYVRNVGSRASLDAAKAVAFDVLGAPDPNPDPATGVALTASPASPQAASTPVTFTAAGDGGTGTYEYQFWLRTAGVPGWKKVQDYSADATWSWDTTGQDGAHEVVVRTRSMGSNVSFDTSARLPFQVGGLSGGAPSVTPATGVTLTADLAEPQAAGNVVTFTAAGEGGTGNYEYEFALQGPATGDVMIVQQAYAPVDTWSWDTTGDAGTNTIRVRARTAGTDSPEDASLMLTYAVQAAPPPVTSVTVEPDVAAPLFEGGAVTFRAAAAGGSGDYEYEFALQGPGTGGVMTVQRAYAASDTWTWDTTGHRGTSTVRVRVRNAGATGAEDAATTLSYAVVGPASGILLSASASSPQPAGASVMFTAAGQGGTGTYEYQFWRRAVSDSAWTMVRNYAPAATWTWDTTGFEGAHVIMAYVRNRGSAASKDALTALTFEVTAPGTEEPTPVPSVTGVTLNADVPSPQTPGTSVAFTAAGQGGTGTYEYQFWRQPAGGGTWTMVRAYGAAPTWVWDTTGFDGAYSILVYARTVGSSVSFEATTAMPYTVSATGGGAPVEPVTGATLTVDVPSPQPAGAPITLTADGSGGSGAYEYEFWKQPSGSGTWTRLRAYGRANSVMWDTTGQAGTWDLWVNVRNEGSSAAAEATTALSYIVDPSADTRPTGVSLVADVPSPQPAGTIVRFTAAGQGGTGAYEYAFWRRPAGDGMWVRVQDYGASPNWGWNTAGFAGAYRVAVGVRAAGSLSALDAFQELTFQVEAAGSSDVALTADRTSPQPAGATVTWTGRGPDSGEAYEYAFWLHGPGTGFQWQLARDFAADATWSWHTAGVSGAHTVVVWARPRSASDDSLTALRHETFVVTPGV